MHAVHVLTPKRFPALTSDKLLRRTHPLTVHTYEIHAAGHIAEVDAGMVVSQLNGLDHLAEGVVNYSFLHFHIAFDAQLDVVVGWVRHQTDALSQYDVFNSIHKFEVGNQGDVFCHCEGIGIISAYFGTCVIGPVHEAIAFKSGSSDRHLCVFSYLAAGGAAHITHIGVGTGDGNIVVGHLWIISLEGGCEGGVTGHSEGIGVGAESIAIVINPL